MKATLNVQEGPGAGRSYPLDPSKQILLSVGRSGNCNIILKDHRASRYHADIRWNGRRWQVVDRESTNGTYVNGLQVHGPYDLQLGDRVTIGETTMVMREGAPPAQAASSRQAVDPGPEIGPRTAAARGLLFWLAQILAGLAVVCLASGAFLPWIEVTGSLSQEMEPLIQSITEIISSFMGSDFLFVTQQISGLEGYGKLTLGLALIAAVVLLVDLFVQRRTVVPGLVYLLSGLLATGAMAADLKNLYDVYNQVQSVSLLFGIKLADVIEVFDQFIQVEVILLPGLYLTGLGLVALLSAGGVRLLGFWLDRGAVR
jgi:hypothetical protein